MTDGEGAMGKLVLLRQVREEVERRALAAAAGAEARAREAEVWVEEERRDLALQLDRVRGGPADDQPPAQVLQLRTRLERRLRARQGSVELRLAQVRRERIGSEEAMVRARAELAVARRAREQAQERAEAIRRERRRRRQQAEESAGDDLGTRRRPGGGGSDGSGWGPG